MADRRHDVDQPGPHDSATRGSAAVDARPAAVCDVAGRSASSDRARGPRAPRRDLSRRLRPREVEALADVAAEAAQRLELLGGLDALGHGGQPSERARLEDGGDDGAVATRCGRGRR